jgi:hypothetical protein
MEVSRSGYYSWRKRGKSAREKERDQLSLWLRGSIKNHAQLIARDALGWSINKRMTKQSSLMSFSWQFGEENLHQG